MGAVLWEGAASQRASYEKRIWETYLEIGVTLLWILTFSTGLAVIVKVNDSKKREWERLKVI